MEELKNKISGNPFRSLAMALILIVIFLLGMDLLQGRISEVFDNKFALNKEANIPTWYSAILLYSVSIASFILYSVSKRNICQNSIWRFFWIIFGLMYLFLSFDESATIHEIIDENFPIKWIYVYAPVVGAFFVIAFIYFIIIRKDIRSTGNLIISGLIIFALGGMGLEFVSDVFAPLPKVLQKIEFMMEEGFEMTGTIIVLIGCLNELYRIIKIRYVDLTD